MERLGEPAATLCAREGVEGLTALPGIGPGLGRLPGITPRRFNPRRARWLPVLHTSHGGRHYTAMYSNTPRAHRLHRTKDWVVIYYDGPDGDGQATVVTEY